MGARNLTKYILALHYDGTCRACAVGTSMVACGRAPRAARIRARGSASRPNSARRLLPYQPTWRDRQGFVPYQAQLGWTVYATAALCHSPPTKHLPMAWEAYNTPASLWGAGSQLCEVRPLCKAWCTDGL